MGHNPISIQADQVIKPILGSIAEDIIIPKGTLDFWQWISEYYMIPLGSVFEFAFTGILALKSKERFRRTEKKDQFFG